MDTSGVARSETAYKRTSMNEYVARASAKDITRMAESSTRWQDWVIDQHNEGRRHKAQRTALTKENSLHRERSAYRPKNRLHPDVQVRATLLTLIVRIVPSNNNSVWAFPGRSAAPCCKARERQLRTVPQFSGAHFARVPMTVEALPDNVEQLTIAIERGLLSIAWAQTRAAVAVAAK